MTRVACSKRQTDLGAESLPAVTGLGQVLRGYLLERVLRSGERSIFEA